MNKKSIDEAPGVLCILKFVSYSTMKQMTSSVKESKFSTSTGMFFSSLCFNGSLKRKVKKFARDYRSVFNEKGNHDGLVLCHS